MTQHGDSEPKDGKGEAGSMQWLGVGANIEEPTKSDENTHKWLTSSSLSGPKEDEEDIYSSYQSSGRMRKIILKKGQAHKISELEGE